MHAAIRQEIDMSDTGDAFGNIASWGFAIAGTLYRHDAYIPSAWRYRPGLFAGTLKRDEDYEGGMLEDLLAAGEITLDDIRDAGAVIMRYWSTLEIQGRAY